MSELHQATIFRNYDIRGLALEELHERNAFQIAQALAQMYEPHIVAVGRDNRPSGIEIFRGLAAGFENAGVLVRDLGLITTPMSYYYSGTHPEVDMTVMITASHMPAQYNGLKICTEDAVPLTSEEIARIGEVSITVPVPEHPLVPSAVAPVDMLPEWYQHFKERINFTAQNHSVVIDPANMVGTLELRTFDQFPDLTVHGIYTELDHTTPHHEANPIIPETLVDLGNAVRQHQATMGIAFDGDADRVGFTDENGQFVPADIAGALIARELFCNTEHENGEVVIYDLRSSHTIPDIVNSMSGTALEWKVGHSHIRKKMREENAIMGIELAGHFFFRETFFSEGGALPALLLLKHIAESGKPLSELVAEIQTYAHSGEINSSVTRPVAEIYDALALHFADAEKSNLDGMSLKTESWWLNVRPSANDPVLRLNVEAQDKATMEQVRNEALAIIRA